MYLAVIDVKPQNDYLLLLTFENGEQRLFDMKPYMDKGVFRELKDPIVFNTVRASFDTIEWINEADIDPEILYDQSIAIN
jgi:hypothetical protein